jgi:hypothetical protein
VDIQLIIAMGIGLAALFYIGLRFYEQLREVEKDPKCDDCPVIDSDKYHK